MMIPTSDDSVGLLCQESWNNLLSCRAVPGLALLEVILHLKEFEGIHFLQGPGDSLISAPRLVPRKREDPPPPPKEDNVGLGTGC